MTTAEIKERAKQWRNCGLARDADLLVATASLLDAIDAGAQVDAARAAIANLPNEGPR